MSRESRTIEIDDSDTIRLVGPKGHILEIEWYLETFIVRARRSGDYLVIQPINSTQVNIRTKWPNF